jgi:hypothetical protein
MSRDRLVAAGMELFDETGEWPKVDWVQRALVTWRDDTNASREARRLPASLGVVEDGRLILGVRAFHQTEPGSRLVETFWIGLREAWRRYLHGNPPDDVLLSVSDLVNHAHFTEVEAKKTIEMLAVEGLVEKKTERVWAVVPAIRHYKSARSVDDYLEMKRRFERKRCLRRAPTKSIKPLQRLLRADRWVGALIIATLATLLATFALWIGEEAFGPSPNSDVPPNAQPEPKSEGNPGGRTPPAPAGRR